MAAGSADKENAAPSASDAAAVAVPRRHAAYGYALTSCGVKKRPSKERRLLGRRVPLRDITNLVEAISAAAEVSPAAATESTETDAVLPAPVVRLAAVQDGGDAAAGPAAKVASHSLLKDFR